MKLQSSLIHVALAQCEEIGLRSVTADFKAQATGLKTRCCGVFEHDGEKFVNLLWVDFENDNDIDHGGTERRFSVNMQPVFRVSFWNPLTIMKACIISIAALCAFSSLPAQDAKSPPSATTKPESTKAPAAKAPEKTTAKPAPPTKQESKTAKEPIKPATVPAKTPTTPAKAAKTPEKPATATPAPAKPAPPKPVAVFPDKALEAVVRRQVFAKRDTQEVLTAEDVATVSIIEGKEAGIKDLSGLEKCTALASLTLPGNQITNLTAIKGLERLQFLDVSHNQISDIGPLAACKGLQYVELTGNQVADVSPLAGIDSLTSLYLAGNKIKDASPLFKLPKVWTLYLEGNQVSDLTGIGGMKWLSMLSLKGNGVTDISPLEPLTELQFLFLENNEITDFSPLHRMWKKDNDGPREWAPYCQIFIEGNPINEASKTLVEQMKKAGARITP